MPRTLDLTGALTFAAELRRGGFAPPDDPGSWSAELVAAHVAPNNAFWTETARRVAAGEQPTYDNEPAVDADELGAYVRAAGGDLETLAVAVERTAAELAAAYEGLDDDQAARPVLVRIHHDGELVVDEPRPVGVMVEGNATFHQQMHLEQLLALRPTAAG